MPPHMEQSSFLTSSEQPTTGAHNIVEGVFEDSEASNSVMHFNDSEMTPFSSHMNDSEP